MPLEIDCEDPEVRICSCCGHENLSLFRTIHDGENALAVYLVTLPAHAGFPVVVLLTMGRLDDDASPAERFAMAFQIVSQSAGYGTMIIEPSDAGWGESDFATLLSRAEARARFSKEIFAFSDLIIAVDPVIRSYLDASLTHGMSTVTRH
ncbi:hypothetical protein [Rhizobium sp. MHM7A]|uniref:hypothetical protein n=1 Tax=Rhizobium sp. MHM7A TaxID=2583233 RepID=UPI001106DEF3|nr:hypothetical protein [Rhizobium sp. MHM7A]TLX16580.1 hypothetical protein FFR93_04370 [Rhizobium sp. MHM7A]